MANLQSEKEQLAQLENLFKQKNFAAGLILAENVLQQFPASFHLKFLKVKFLIESQRPEEALQALLEMHVRFGDNIMILKELADLNFQHKKIPESLIYYKKLLFLDSFNIHAQERVKQIQGILEAGVSEKLADTKIEVRSEASQAAFSGKTPATAASAPEPTLITFEETIKPISVEQEKGTREPGQELNFETESAAELYFKQGLYKEALAIYKKLFEKTGRTDFFLKIKAILLLQRNEQSGEVIARLQRFLELIQTRGSQIV